MMTKTTGFTWEMEYDEKAAEKDGHRVCPDTLPGF